MHDASNRLKISSILLLLLAGIGLSQIRLGGEHLLSFPLTFLTSLAVLTLEILLFVLVGLVISVSPSLEFFAKFLILFVAYLFIRLLS